ncbi:TonB-dependent receptor [Pontibacter sp. Tf4]|uniref:outer membrane beta-barrel protein n=1 Tax=Pontibacter sp. Tf4 TaxID=2761620 RepID=UPI0016288353|nr:outer membrane beta-barrel family protein [Pontibacter sp. Tf4]MBB6611645.1 TonB-dependent receptor [Pontibacter sp. Tf4]
MRLLKLLIVMLLLSQGAWAQGILTGQVKDEKGQPLGFVNVAVLNAATSAVITGAIADMDGQFKIATPAAGSYKLKMTLLGYKPQESDVFEVKGSNSGKDFGTLILSEEASVLREVTVQAMRQTVITEADRTIVNVAGSAMSGGASAYDVLSNAPGISTDMEGNLKLNGKAGVQVLIDGRQAYLSGKELQNLLQTMPAGNIRDLEIITSPDASHDAEGTSGVIKINLKKNMATGMQGSVYGGYQYSDLHGYTYGSDLNYKQGRWNTSAALDVTRRTYYGTSNMQRTFNNEQVRLQQQVRETNSRTIPSLRLSSDYALNSRHSIGFIANLSRYTSASDIHTNAFMLQGNPTNDLYIKAANSSEATYSNTTFNLHYNGKPDTLGTTLSADLDYVRLSSTDATVFRNVYDSLAKEEPSTIVLLSADNPSVYDIYAARADYSRAVGIGNLQLGAKASRVVSDNELHFYETTDGVKEPDESRSNHFIYTENILAAYTNLNTTLSPKLQLQAGLRAEQTITNGKSATIAPKAGHSYLDLFPSLLLKQTINDNYQVNYSYSRRITRPRYSVLNPFVMYLDPYSLVMGNPDLKPQYSHSFSITQTLQQRFNLVLDYTLTKDYIVEVPAKTATGKITIFQQQNIDDMQTISATLAAPVRIAANWEMNNTGTMLYQHFAQNRGDVTLKNEQLSYILQTNHNLLLPWGIRLEASAGYQSRIAYGLYDLNSNWWLNAGLKRSFMNDKLDLSLNMTDIFRTRSIDGSTQMETYAIEAKQYKGTQSFRVNLRYRFSKGATFDAKKRQSDLDEVNRAGK